MARKIKISAPGYKKCAGVKNARRLVSRMMDGDFVKAENSKILHIGTRGIDVNKRTVTKHSFSLL